MLPCPGMTISDVNLEINTRSVCLMTGAFITLLLRGSVLRMIALTLPEPTF